MSTLKNSEVKSLDESNYGLTNEQTKIVDQFVELVKNSESNYALSSVIYKLINVKYARRYIADQSSAYIHQLIKPIGEKPIYYMEEKHKNIIDTIEGENPQYIEADF